MDANIPARPPTLSFPRSVKNIPLVLRQLRLLCRKDRPVFSPALKMYFAESKLTTTVGSVSEETVLRTVADQFGIARAARAEDEKHLLRDTILQSELSHKRNNAASVENCKLLRERNQTE